MTAVHSGEELDSGAIKDKASKISYLDKLVALVGICSGHSIDVRPSKVVAGLEPEGTNALLTVGGREGGRQRKLWFIFFIVLFCHFQAFGCRDNKDIQPSLSRL